MYIIKLMFYLITESIGSTHLSKIKRSLSLVYDFLEDLSSTENEAYLLVGAYQKQIVCFQSWA